MDVSNGSQRQNRRVYSTEQLHRLRGTVSTPKLNESIEEHDGDEADLVKEHVLRGSKSFAARSWKSRTSGHSLRIPSNKENRAGDPPAPERPSFTQHANALAPILGEIAANNQQIIRPGQHGRARRSPTPSLKRKKVEAIVRAHGSPTHVRVTAGGRIVPSEQSPLCHPRYGYSAIKTNGGLIKFAPNHPMGKSQWTQATQNGFVAQDADGRLCQIVDGDILPLKEIEGALQLYMPAPNLNVTQRASSITAVRSNHVPQLGAEALHGPLASNPMLPSPSIPAQINALELEYSKLDHELKDVDKTEVMHGRTMGKVAKEALISKRRELVTSLDNVRKATKSLKQHSVGSDAAIASGGPHQKNAASPVLNRLPPFLQPRQPNQELSLHQLAHPTAYGHFLGQHQSFVGPYAFGPNTSPEIAYNTLAWTMPPPSIYAPASSFDQSLSGVPLQIPMTLSSSTPVGQCSQSTSMANDNLEPMHAAPIQPPRSTFPNEQQNAVDPKELYATGIQVPDQKVAQVPRSHLNPMSPEYRPLRTSPPKSAPIPGVKCPGVSNEGLPATQHSDQKAGSPNRDLPEFPRTSEETVGQSRKTTHLQSSSNSSFETADFFPRNTHEYSTRQHILNAPDPINSQDHNDLSVCSSPAVDHVLAKKPDPVVGDDHACKSPSADFPAAPPGTPVSQDATTYSISLPVIVNNTALEGQHPVLEAPAPDRGIHNVSPKTKRQEWEFIEERPDREQVTDAQSPTKEYACTDELYVSSSPQDTLDFSRKSRDWIEGYQAGLNRYPVGSSRMGEFLDGYCSGLLKSSPTNIGPSTGSPTKPASRRPSPVPNTPRCSIGAPLSTRVNVAARPIPSSKELKITSFDALKQAVLAPHNENTVLTPAADGPHVDEMKFSLGGWAKARSTSPTLNKQIPAVTISHDDRDIQDNTLSGMDNNTDEAQSRNNQTIPAPLSSTMSASSLASNKLLSTGNDAHRISSITSVESRFYRQWPGSRVVSPNLEWKSGSSVSHQTGLATGFFAHAQFDGSPHARRPGSATTVESGSEHMKALPYSGRFREASAEIVAPTSLPPPSAETSSPKASPSKKIKDHPSTKAASPARTTFENIAEKVGINVSADTNSPPGGPGKRRWRDVWRGSTKKEGNKDPGNI